MVESRESRREVRCEVEEQLFDAQYSENARRKLVTTIYQEFYPFLRAKLHRTWSSDKLHDPAIDADDIIQETLLKAYRNLDSFCGNSIAQVQAWILAIARNVMRDKMRIAQRRRIGGITHCQVNERAPDPQRLVNLIDPRGEEPSEILATSEESANLLHLLIDSLTETQQSIILYLLRGLPVTEIAVEMGMTPGTVRVTRLRALRRLRERIGHKLPSDSSEREHDQHVIASLMERVQGDFSPLTWQAFRRHVQEGEPAGQVAEALGLSLNSVLLAKSRVLKRLRQEAAGLVE